MRSLIGDPHVQLYVSAVTAFEFQGLRIRGRFGEVPSLPDMLQRLEAILLPLPAEVWTVIDGLPNLHRDPIDRMLVAHAIHADLPLATADETMRSYPISTIW